MDLWRDNSGAGLSLNLGPMEDRNNCCVFELKELAPDEGRTRCRVTTEPKLIFQNFQVGAELRFDRGPGQDRDDAEDVAKQSWCQMRGGVGTKTKQKQT
ncbi:tRNA nucleotidyltransferase [Corchorus olitorius]|uniref:tRNA nucleotidyltransferase n=1 Tax=Corchorus olitorius TaxID=93759 RepID=A0A1R3L0B1_9ROSI|nr:tRNA nucleotidyltransferase [Corchorus olitorius]